VAGPRFQVTRIDDLERIPLEGKQWRPIRRAPGVTGFGINAYTAAGPGDEVIEPHDETSAGAGGHEELYLVVSGSAESEIDGEKVGAPAGTLIQVPVAAHRVATATEPETTVLVIGGVPARLLPGARGQSRRGHRAPANRGGRQSAGARVG
jgi:uncharacterized cupin superfamily protein